MKLRAWITASVLGVSVCGAAAAGEAPPLDRPSPPPYCADGICYPNPITWGTYPTRWRRWPTEHLAPLPPGVRPPAPLPADVPPYETPTPEEEDRRAPPPTRVPAIEDRPEFEPAPPPNGVPPVTTPPVVPPTVPLGPPPSLFDEPEVDVTPQPLMPPEPPPTTLPFGGEPPAAPLPFGEPMGEVDPPPALPFVAPTLPGAPANRAAVNPANGPTHRPAGPTRPAPSDDPPPALPITLAGWSR